MTHLPALTASPVIEVRGRIHDLEAERRELVSTLTQTPRSIPSKHFYDATGGRLFDRITRLPEYYQTRTERAILAEHAAEIAETTQAVQLVELGPGSASKTRLLLEPLWTAGSLASYVPFDVDESMLRAVADQIAVEHPGLEIRGLVGDFTTHVAPLPRPPVAGARLVIFLGGTIGNLHPRDEAPAFLRQLGAAMAPGDHLLLGVDSIKELALIEAAYNDGEGLTAEFNRNILRVANRLLDADFDPDLFEHRAFYDRENDWIEMRLVSSRRQLVRLGADRPTIEIEGGEEIRTEISAKYDRHRLEKLLHRGGFRSRSLLTDDQSRFAVVLADRRA